MGGRRLFELEKSHLPLFQHRSLQIGHQCLHVERLIFVAALWAEVIVLTAPVSMLVPVLSLRINCCCWWSCFAIRGISSFFHSSRKRPNAVRTSLADIPNEFVGAVISVFPHAFTSHHPKTAVSSSFSASTARLGPPSSGCRWT